MASRGRDPRLDEHNLCPLLGSESDDRVRKVALQNRLTAVALGDNLHRQDVLLPHCGALATVSPIRSGAMAALAAYPA
jgi:hypothetical protein